MSHCVLKQQTTQKMYQIIAGVYFAAIVMIFCSSYHQTSFLLQGYQLNYQTRLFSVVSMNDLSALSRQQLQALAKMNGIRANMKTIEIIDSLKKLESLEESEDLSANVIENVQLNGTVPVTALSMSENVLGALASQGIDLSDLLEFRQKITSASNEAMADLEINDDIVVLEDSDLKGTVTRRRRSVSTSPKLKKETSPPQKVTAKKSENNTETLKSDEVAISNPIEDSPVIVHPPLRRKSNTVRPAIGKVDLTGVTLSTMVTSLVASVGFNALYEETNLRCFKSNPSVKSTLKVLRQEDMLWARKKIEHLFVTSIKNGVVPDPIDS